MPTPYPRKQTAILFLICAAAVGITAYYVRAQSRELPTRNNISVEVENGTSTNNWPDNSDWKNSFEQLSELATSDQKKNIASTQDSKTFSDLTATERFGRELFTKYVALKQSNGLDNPSSIESATEELIAQELFADEKPRIYTAEEIYVSSNSDSSALKQYGNTVGALIKANTPTTNDLVLAYEGIKAEDYSFVAQINKNLAMYKKILAGLLVTPTPTLVKEDHLNTVNGISYLIYVSSSLTKVETDPLRGLTALSEFTTASELLSKGVQGIKTKLSAFEISYAPQEGGSYFKMSQL